MEVRWHWNLNMTFSLGEDETGEKGEPQWTLHIHLQVFPRAVHHPEQPKDLRHQGHLEGGGDLLE